MDLTITKENVRSSDQMNETEEEEDVYQISSGDEDCSRGMKSMHDTKMIAVSSIISFI